MHSAHARHAHRSASISYISCSIHCWLLHIIYRVDKGCTVCMQWIGGDDAPTIFQYSFKIDKFIQMETETTDERWRQRHRQQPSFQSIDDMIIYYSPFDQASPAAAPACFNVFRMCMQKRKMDFSPMWWWNNLGNWLHWKRGEPNDAKHFFFSKFNFRIQDTKWDWIKTHFVDRIAHHELIVSIKIRCSLPSHKVQTTIGHWLSWSASNPLWVNGVYCKAHRRQTEPFYFRSQSDKLKALTETAYAWANVDRQQKKKKRFGRITTSNCVEHKWIHISLCVWPVPTHTPFIQIVIIFNGKSM